MKQLNKRKKDTEWKHEEKKIKKEKRMHDKEKRQKRDEEQRKEVCMDAKEHNQKQALRQKREKMLNERKSVWQLNALSTLTHQAMRLAALLLSSLSHPDKRYQAFSQPCTRNDSLNHHYSIHA